MGRIQIPKEGERKCPQCGACFKPKHHRSKLCGSACVTIRARDRANHQQKTMRHALVYVEALGLRHEAGIKPLMEAGTVEELEASRDQVLKSVEYNVKKLFAARKDEILKARYESAAYDCQVAANDLDKAIKYAP